jgi:hypothetical protein
VRNVLTRGLAELILDAGDPHFAGIAASIPRKLLDGLEAMAEFAGGTRPLGERGADAYEWTAARRRSFASGITERILQLSSTYQAQVAFRDRVLDGTEHGRELVARYERHLPAIWSAVRDDPGLIGSCLELWLEIHPFVAAVVGAADGAQPAAARFEPAQGDRIRELARTFLDASDDEEFQRVVRAVVEELDGYVGLDAGQALDRFRGT